jgi:two-component sensor histidine kinase
MRPIAFLRERRWARWLLGFLVWTLLGLFESLQTYFSSYADGGHVTAPQALALGLLLWYGWAVLWLFIYLLVRRLPLERGNWGRRLLLHLAAGVVFALAKPLLDYPVIRFFYCPQPERLTLALFYQIALSEHFFNFVLICWAMMGVGHAWHSYVASWEQGLRASELEAALARTQLQVLIAQLQPHFLFNTLNGISALISQDPPAAERMVARLGDLLRLTLEESGAQEATLERELRIVRAYLEIEQVRFGARLRVETDVAADVRDARVPHLLLQPLVENALRHGVGRKAGPARVVIRARREGAGLRLVVEDDGVGLPASFREGVGLSNTRARLRRLYGDGHGLRLTGGPTGGVRVTVDLPLRREEETPAPAPNGAHPARQRPVVAAEIA